MPFIVTDKQGRRRPYVPPKKRKRTSRADLEALREIAAGLAAQGGAKTTPITDDFVPARGPISASRPAGSSPLPASRSAGKSASGSARLSGVSASGRVSAPVSRSSRSPVASLGDLLGDVIEFGSRGGVLDDRVGPSVAEQVRRDPKIAAEAAALFLPAGLARQAAVRVAPSAVRALRGAKATRESVRAASKGPGVASRGKSAAEVARKPQRIADRARGAAKRAGLEARFQANRVALAAAGAGGAGAAASASRESARRAAAREAAGGRLTRGEVARRVATAPGRAAARGTTGVSRAALSPAAIPVSSAAGSEQGVHNFATLPYQLGRATVRDPGRMATATVKSTQEMLMGLPAAIYQIATSPREAAGQMIADFRERYAPLIEGDFDEFERVALQTGITPFALDALIGVTPASQVIGRAAKAGTLGARAERFANRTRPDRLMTPETAITPRSSSGIVGMGVQRVSDALATRRTARKAEAGDDMAATANVLGAVVPMRSKRGLHMEAARVKAIFRQMMIGEQGHVLKHASDVIGQMSKIQKEAVKDALDLGIRTPEQAKDMLTARVAAITRHRDGAEYGKLDNIPELMRVIEQADEIFTPEFGRLVDELRRTEKRAVGKVSPSGRRDRKSDPGLDTEQAAVRRYQPLAEHLGIKRIDGESAKDFIARVDAERKRRGLAAPGYFPSELSRRRRFAERAVGGTRASHRTKPYSGELFRQGIENRDISVLQSGLARNIKRRYNWNLVSEVIERNAHSWGRGKSLTDLQKEMGRANNGRGINEDSVRFMNPGILRRAAEPDTEGPKRAMGGLDDRMANETLTEALGRAVVSPRAYHALPEEFKNAPGWYAVPKAVADELESGFKSTAAGRLADVLQEKGQRYMLVMNTGWLGFQAASNIAQAALAGVNPFDYARAVKLKRALSADEKNQLAAFTGLAQSNEMRQATHLGAATSNAAVETYRLMKESEFGRRMAKGNIFEWFFKGAHLTDNLPRQAVLYRLARKKALKDMEKSMGRMWAMQERISNMMDADPNGQISAYLKNPKLLEDFARELNEFMGDYTTFTARERAYLKRFIPFYSWSRYSLRLAFYTFPVRHPLMAGILYQLGRLESEEVKELLGNALPWALGKLFVDGGDKSIDVYRGNPVLNAVAELESARDLTSLLPPWVKALGNQIYQQDGWSGKDWKVEGETFSREAVDPGALNRARIAFNELASVFTPYRVVHKARAQGESLGADSLAFDLRPSKYADESLTEMRKGDFEKRGGAWGVIRESFLPFIPKDASDVKGMAEYASERLENERKKIESHRNRISSSSGSASGGDYDSASMWGGSSQGFDSASMWGGN